MKNTMAKRMLQGLSVLLMLALGSYTAQAQAPTVWVVPSTLLRVGQTDAAGSGTTATLSGGGGEYVDFQVAVQAPSGGSGLTISNFTTTSLIGPAGVTIPTTDLILYRESYITIKKHSPTTDEDSCGPGPYSDSNVPYCGDNGVQGSTTNIGTPNVPIAGVTTFPDPLIPFIDPATGSAPASGSTYVAVPASLSAGNNAVFWVDIAVPRATTAGTYTGTYTVTTNTGSVTGTIDLTVWNFMLPLQPSLKSLFDGDDNQSAAVVAGVQAELMRNRLMPDPSTSLTTANVSADIAAYGFNTYDTGYFNGVYYGSCSPTTNPPSVSTVQGVVGSLPAGLYLADYSSDPESSCSTSAYYNSVIAYAQVLHQATTASYPNGVNNMVSQQPVSALFSDGLGTGRSAVDDWTLLPYNYDIAQLDTTDVEDGGANAVASVLLHGDHIWSYNTGVQDAYSSKWELDFLPVNYRIQPGFLNQSLDITGLVYWAVADWTSSKGCPSPTSSPTPTSTTGGKDWTNPQGCQNPNYPGEGILVYPGEPAGLQSNSTYAGVAPSMRLKYLRDGVQDYEYFQLLKGCAQTLSQSVWNTLSLSGTESPNFHDWTMNEANLESARLALGAQLNTCSGGGSSTTASVSPTSLAFGNQTVGTTSAAQSVTLSNTGSSTLTISSITFTGTNASDFAQTNTCGSSLAANTNCTIHVTFTPAATGSRSATLSVTDNASNSPQTTSLSGTGVAAPNFTISATTPASVTAGSNTTSTVTVSPVSGFTGTVALTVTGLPSGATGTFSPTSISGGSGTSTLTIVTTTSTAAGSYPLTIKGTSGSLIQTTNVTLTVTVVAVSISPTTASVQTTKTQQFTATVTGTSNTAVTWRVNAVTGGNSTVGTVSTSGLYTAPATVPSPATVTVTAISQANTAKSASATVTVTKPITVSVTAPVNNAQVSGNTTLTATASGGVGGVAKVQFVIDLGYSDQENAGAAITSSPYSTTFNFATLAPAWYTVSAVATDTAGNTATSTIDVQDTN